MFGWIKPLTSQFRIRVIDVYIIFFNIKPVFQIQIINKIFASCYTVLLLESGDFGADNVTDCFSEMSVNFDEHFNWKYVIFRI
jgi:hypothetical protein